MEKGEEEKRFLSSPGQGTFNKPYIKENIKPSPLPDYPNSYIKDYHSKEDFVLKVKKTQKNISFILFFLLAIIALFIVLVASYIVLNKKADSSNNVPVVPPINEEYFLDCLVLDQTGKTYELTKDIHAKEECFKIQGENITLDCRNFNIIAENNITLISSDKQVIIKNCNLVGASIQSQLAIGIKLSSGADNSIISNTKIISNNPAIILENVSGIKLENSYLESKIVIIDSSNNEFKDSILSSLESEALVVESKYKNSTNNVFLNVSYDSSKQRIVSLQGFYSEIKRKWYYLPSINYNSIPLEANLSIYENNILVYSGIYNEKKGFKDLIQLTEYNDNGARNYYPYIINVSALDISIQKELNLTQKIQESFSGTIFDYIELSNPLSSCTSLIKANSTYNLVSDVYSKGTCFRILADNITLNGNGHKIVYGDSGSSLDFYGIHAYSKTNLKINNLTLINPQDFNPLHSSGINITNCTSLSLSNIDAKGSYNGIYLSSILGSYFSNITADNNEKGIFISESSNNYFSGLKLSENNYGLSIVSSHDNLIESSFIYENNYSDVEVIAYSNIECNNILNNVIGSGSRNIGYYNSSVNLDGRIFSELILCNADNSLIKNITVHASKNKNNLLLLINTDNSVFENINSSSCQRGIHIVSSSGNIFSELKTSYNKDYGVYLASGYNNSFINSSSNKNLKGILVSTKSEGTSLINFNANFNSHYGIEFYSKNMEIVSSVMCFNGLYDFFCDSYSDSIAGSGNYFSLVKSCTSWPIPGNNYDQCTGLYSLNPSKSTFYFFSKLLKSISLKAEFY